MYWNANTQSSGDLGYAIVIVTIHNVITIAPMISADKQKSKVREEGRAKRKPLQKAL